MKKITLTRPAPYPFNGKTLIPGENTVNDDYIAVMMANPVVMADINAGILQIGHGQAAKEIEATAVDLDALRELAAGDGRRKDVQEARARLAEIEGAE